VLYRPEAYEPLTDEPWVDGRVRDEIAAIVADADAAFDADELWPACEWEAWQTPLPLKTLYVGAAGVLWALDALRRRGLAAPSLDLASAAARTVERRREQPDLMEGIELPLRAESGLLSGEEWLDRARRFSVHALGQVRRARAERGRGRYALWTGDVGTALFAADCLDGRARYPILGGDPTG
jgi:hypothetical protein